MNFLPNSHLHMRYRRLFSYSVIIFIFFCAEIFAKNVAYPPGRDVVKLQAHPVSKSGGFLFRRNAHQRDEECRNVHHYRDKCAFVRQNCADEEVGRFDYLEFYYCRLRNFPVFAGSVMAVWLGVLFTTIGIAASDFFCVNLSTIAHILGMSESMAGVTFLAFGNGSPDVFSTFAAMKVNSGSLAVGELIGAATFIVAVVGGSMAIVRPFRVARKSFVRDVSFFTVAVMFGIYFLADGVISAWECAVMISYYVFYVFFVVLWHWWMTRKRRRRWFENQAREHYTSLEEEEPLLDNDEDGRVGESSELLGSHEDVRILESGLDVSEEEDEEEEQQAYAELNNRISRPGVRNISKIRPSLVSALEFRSVLNSLAKSKNLRGGPIHLRRYLDGRSPERYSAPGTLMHNTPVGSFSGDNSYLANAGDHLVPPQLYAVRARAGSVNDAEQLYLQPPYVDTGLSTLSEHSTPRMVDQILTPPRSGDRLTLRVPSPNLLAPPSPDGLTIRSSVSSLSLETQSQGSHSKQASENMQNGGLAPASHIPIQLNHSHNSTLNQCFHGGDRLMRDSDSELTIAFNGTKWKRAKYWPYGLLPPPQVILGKLFPTLRNFRDKTAIQKFMALVAAPCVFLLTITLPVVEDGVNTNKGHDSSTINAQEDSSSPTRPTLEPLVPSLLIDDGAPIGGAEPRIQSPFPDLGEGDWGRWLLAIQCIISPLFVTVMLFEFSTTAVLYSLLFGLTALLLLLSFTKPNHRPRLLYLLCFAGFIVSITWISTVAHEVVGVLKAIGVILDISDAILGLTIFAVGNSLGDLVADITVARLGFPVMALSACFGGPMLNILLGIGVSGLYMSLTHDKDAYKIEVSSTLVISAATLLASLIILLIAVPANKWTMSRKIGAALICLWCVSTVVNVAVEVAGLGKKLSVQTRA